MTDKNTNEEGKRDDADAADDADASANASLVAKALEVTVRIGLVVGIVAWCFLIIRPFIEVVVWATVLAVAIYPVYERAERALGGRRKLTAVLYALLALALVLGPAVMLTDTLVGGAKYVASGIRDGTLRLPEPSAGVAGWPIVGGRLHEVWTAAADDLPGTLRTLGPQLRPLADGLLKGTKAALFAVVELIAAILISAFLVTQSVNGGQLLRRLARRLAGEHGLELVDLARDTVRSVTKGILGVAVIQTAMAAAGILVVGIPAAGLFSLAVLILCVVQLGPLLVLLPLTIYVFSTAEPLTASLFLVWNLCVLLIDNVLKPILLGRGVKVPMLVVFLGAIGGLVASGVLGLFVGPVVLVVGYRLFNDWLGPRLRKALPTEAPLEGPSDAPKPAS